MPEAAACTPRSFGSRAESEIRAAAAFVVLARSGGACAMTGARS
jgi:hypothetical protein